MYFILYFAEKSLSSCFITKPIMRHFGRFYVTNRMRKVWAKLLPYVIGPRFLKKHANRFTRWEILLLATLNLLNAQEKVDLLYKASNKQKRIDLVNAIESLRIMPHDPCELFYPSFELIDEDREVLEKDEEFCERRDEKLYWDPITRLANSFQW